MPMDPPYEATVFRLFTWCCVKLYHVLSRFSVIHLLFGFCKRRLSSGRIRRCNASSAVRIPGEKKLKCYMAGCCCSNSAAAPEIIDPLTDVARLARRAALTLWSFIPLL